VGFKVRYGRFLINTKDSFNIYLTVRYFFRHLRCFIIFNIIFNVGFPSVANTVDLDKSLIPHRAIYSMNLVGSPGDGGLSNVHGVMTYEFKDQCDAWAIESKVYMRLQYVNNSESENIRSMLTWESKDGLNFDFRLKDVTDGKLVEEIKGTAVMDGNIFGGAVKYTQPSLRKVILPPRTLFPTAHIKALIKYAIKGGKHLTTTVFDGATLENPYEVSGVIVARSGIKNPAPAISEALTKIASWKIRMAYFPVKSREQTPEFELDIEMRADGIVSRFVQEFDDYSIEARLSQIDFLEGANC
jgi:hypothetical protein